MTIICFGLLFGGVTRLRSSGLGFPHPPRGDLCGSERGRRERTADVFLHSFGIDSVRGHDPGPPVAGDPLSTRNAHDERGGHDEIYSVVDLQAGPGDRAFEVLREHP